MSAKRQPNPTWLVRDARHPLLAMRHKCVLFAMASRMANPDVEVFPTIPTLAADAAMSPTTTKAALADLVRWGVLERMARPCEAGRRNFYVVNWTALATSAPSDHGPPDETGDYPDPSDDGATPASIAGGGGTESGSSPGGVGRNPADGWDGFRLMGEPESGPKEETVKEETREAPTRNQANNNRAEGVVVGAASMRKGTPDPVTDEELVEIRALAASLERNRVAETVRSMLAAGATPSRVQLSILRASAKSTAVVAADDVDTVLAVWAEIRDKISLTANGTTYAATTADREAAAELVREARKVSAETGVESGRLVRHWLSEYGFDERYQRSGSPLPKIHGQLGAYGIPKPKAPASEAPAPEAPRDWKPREPYKPAPLAPVDPSIIAALAALAGKPAT